MEIERALRTALPTLASLLLMPIHQQEVIRMLTAISPLGEGGFNGIDGIDDDAVFPAASAAAVASLEKREFVAGGRETRDDDDCHAADGCGASATTTTGCSICMEEFEDGEEVSVMPCSRAHEFHQDCIAMWLGIRNTCPLCRHGLPIADDDDQ